MKKFIIIILFIVVIGIGVYFILNKNNPILKQNEWLEIGYNEEEKNKIETLSSTSKDLIRGIPYQKNLLVFINNQEFKEQNLKKYLDFPNTVSPDNIIFIVNHKYSADEYGENTIEFMKQDYYINNLLTRYLDYQNKHSNLTKSQIIAYVNANVDLGFYENTEDSDLTKGSLIIANKHYTLGTYEPTDLVTINAKYGVQGKVSNTAYQPFIKMYEAANKEGLRLYIRSPYRSYNTQVTLYNNYVKRDGKAAADTYSARAGFSDHQTGLTLDITSPTSNFDTFESTKEYNWMQEHAHEYGFIMRYPKGKQDITGYIFESWHYRYVGVEAATYIHEHNITFDEYYAYFVK